MTLPNLLPGLSPLVATTVAFVIVVVGGGGAVGAALQWRRYRSIELPAATAAGRLDAEMSGAERLAAASRLSVETMQMQMQQMADELVRLRQEVWRLREELSSRSDVERELSEERRQRARDHDEFNGRMQELRDALTDERRRHQAHHTQYDHQHAPPADEDRDD